MTKEFRIKLNLANSCIQLSLAAVLVVLASLTFPSDCFHHDDHHPEITAALFVFGDSLIDPGNNNYINTSTRFQANFPPYGESFFKYPSGRFCDGRVIPDFIGKYVGGSQILLRKINKCALLYVLSMYSITSLLCCNDHLQLNTQSSLSFHLISKLATNISWLMVQTLHLLAPVL